MRFQQLLSLDKVAIGAIAGGVSSLVMTGSLKGFLKGAVLGALTAGFAVGLKEGIGVFGKIKDLGAGAVRTTKVIGHGIIGDIRSDWNGGSFSKGLASGAFGKFATPYVQANLDGPFLQGLGIGIVGGISSKLAGGKFEDGFYTAGIGFAANALTSGNIGGHRGRHIRNKRAFEARMHKMVATGHAPVGHQLTYAEAKWWWRNAGGQTLVIDGREVDHIFKKYGFPLNNLQVHGHVSVSPINGRIHDGDYDFEPTHMGGMANLNPIVTVRNYLNGIAIYEHGAGNPFHIEYRYTDQEITNTSNSLSGL